MIKELDQVLHDFLVESQENLEHLDHEFVALEREPENAELLGSIFRTFHSLKGGAGFLNLPQLQQVAHAAEEVLAKLRNRSLTLTTEFTTALLHAVDGIKSILVHLEKTGGEGEHAVQPVVDELNAILVGNPPLTPPRRGNLVGDSPLTPVRQAQDRLPGRGNLTTLEVPPDVQQEMVTELAVQAAPAPSVEFQEEHFEEEKKMETKAQKMAETLEHAPATVEDTRLHVDLGVLDQLMNLTGELVLARNRVTQLAGAATIDPQTFRAVAQRLNVIVSELQETMLKTRMQPVKKVLGMLPRLARDLSQAHGKMVELRLEGQETELDRTLLEALKDPLTHLVRNAIDHGIETPEVRRQQGKAPTGVITITASHEGGQVHIDFADDGAGIDLQKITAKAIQDGVLTPQRAEELTEPDVLQFLFRPGFTTATTVTDISGRGVGMDVVKRNLDRIGGNVEINTELHKGTTVKLRIPITLAIIPVLIVQAGAQRFAIPQVHLEELIMPQRQNGGNTGIETVSGAEVYRLRGELLPLLRLAQVLRLASPTASAGQDATIVVVAAGTTRFGVIVDGVGNTEEIVVKPLSSHVKQLSCYDGATIMGDGKIALILNVNGLLTAAQFDLRDLHRAAQAEQTPAAQALEGAPGEQRQTIVLFRAGQDEYYGVPLAFVVRLEEFPAAQIEHSGGREVLQYRGEILPLLRLEPYLNLPAPPDAELLALIVFQVEKQIGLAVKEVINTVEISTQLDTETFQQKGVLGSTIVAGHSVLILDIHGLIELAYPTWYQKFLVSKLNEAERKQIRVLLVEDSAFFLNIEKSYFASAGYQVVTATHGNEALAILEQQPVDVVVTDMAMPYCDGYELTRMIKARAEWQHIPVMALTVLSGEEDRRKGIEAGIDAYQIKLDREEVLRALELLILRSRKGNNA